MTESWMLIRHYKMHKSDALRQGWLIAKVRNEMSNRVIAFEYLKKDGTIRHALGTLQTKYIPEIKGVKRATNPEVQVYYDAQKNEWRCFKKANLVRVII